MSKEKCKVRCGLGTLDDKTILRLLNNEEFLPSEGYHDPLRGKYKSVMEYEYTEELIGDVKCPVYYLINNGIRSCKWSKSAFDSKFEIPNQNKEDDIR